MTSAAIPNSGETCPHPDLSRDLRPCTPGRKIVAVQFCTGDGVSVYVADANEGVKNAGSYIATSFCYRLLCSVRRIRIERQNFQGAYPKKLLKTKPIYNRQ